MKHAHRWRTARVAQAALVAAIFGAGCQLISGLDGLHHGSTGAGGTSSASSSTGPSTTSGTGGSTSSSTSTSTSSTVTSSSSGCMGTACDAGPCDGGPCDGGPCDGGPCAPPVLLVPAPTAGPLPNSLASDGTYLYWSIPSTTDVVDAGTLNGAIYRKLIDEAPGPGTKVVDSIDPMQVVAGATFVAWSDRRNLGQGIYTNPSDGGPPAVYRYPDKTATTLFELDDMLYWGVTGSPVRISIGPAATSGPPTGNVYPGGGVADSRFAVDDSSLYVADNANIYKVGIGSSVDAGATLLYNFGISGPPWLVADPPPGTRIYWTTDGPGSVNVGSKNGGSVLFSHAFTPSGDIVLGQPLVDDSNIYWFESDDPSCTKVELVRMPAAGGTADTVVALPVGCLTAAQDSKNIFWIHSFNGEIYRWVK